MSSWIRAFSLRLAATALGAGLGMLLFEALLRTASFIPLSSPIYEKDAVTGFRLKPYDATDAEGFNDARSVLPAKNKPSILFVGDSFTFGTYPSDAVFPRLIEDRLTAQGRPHTAYNRGLPGGGPANYVGLIERHAPALRPNLIVVTIFLGNDIEQSHHARRTRLWMGQLGNVIEPWHLSLQPESIMSVMALRKAFREAKNAWHLWGQSQLFESVAVEKNRQSYLFAQAVLYDIEERHLENSRRHLSKFIQDSYENLLENYIPALKAASDRQGAKLLFLLAPSEGQVDNAFFQAMLTYQGRSQDEYDRNKPNEILGFWLDKQGYDYIDLLPILRAAQLDGATYNRGDTHWNRRGNEIVADAVLAWLAQNPLN